jgi:hypothetical protein
MNVTVDVPVLVHLDEMAKERNKNRSAMVTELIVGTSKSSRLIQHLIEAWGKEYKIDAQAVQKLLALLK